jgi:hypothetical protein
VNLDDQELTDWAREAGHRIQCVKGAKDGALLPTHQMTCSCGASGESRLGEWRAHEDGLRHLREVRRSSITRWTERMMLDLIHVRYSKESGNGPRYVVAEHVRNVPGFGAYSNLDEIRATGKRTHLRTIDAIAVDLWPSAGNVVHGFEVKVSRSDWLTELRDPAKAEAFRRYCHHWWLVVPDANIVQNDLPEGWGLLVVDKTGNLRAKKAAPNLTPEPLPLGLTASLLRATARTAERKAIAAYETKGAPR